MRAGVAAVVIDGRAEGVTPGDVQQPSRLITDRAPLVRHWEADPTQLDLPRQVCPCDGLENLTRLGMRTRMAGSRNRGRRMCSAPDDL
jgi:hypothetical protein